ncbi:MAG: 2-amino-4-hydroxy-6-hydroxymethyldihydropteridine diphosphokinase [Rhodocyclaceae bacterium]|nr:2-amino-4-hydroxy-6-hydroxymethyldihydropteridine diphosphokinase [Rhodocyclaceae bacterium]
MPVTAYVGFGANLGDTRATFARTREQLSALPHTALRAASSLYRSAPQGCDETHPDYTNAVFALQTGLAAPALLVHLQRLEAEAGRVRPPQPSGYLPRVLDLDLLLYGDAQIRTPQLVVPHPRMTQRAFVLIPLAQIVPPDFRIPGQNAPLSALVAAVADQPVEPL